jgi:hypothetical protein
MASRNNVEFSWGPLAVFVGAAVFFIIAVYYERAHPKPELSQVPELADCTAHVANINGSVVSVVRCPNSTTTVKHSGYKGRGAFTTVTSDGGPVAGEVKEADASDITVNGK